jgi:pimeloyl-ACP methyl ester carboxylesterase
MEEIYIDDNGKGFPLVLVHGYLGSSEMWSLQQDYLSKFYRVISPALPGFGESYKAKSLDSINEMAKFVINIIDNKKIDKFNLLGHSM